MNVEKRIRAVAKGLDKAGVNYCFIGGASCGFYIDDPNASKVRPREDVDCIVETSCDREFEQLLKQITSLGFEKNDASESQSRWEYNGIKVDIVPACQDENRWYREGIRKCKERIMGDVTVRYLSLPYFLASKLEALKHRGADDLSSSKDFEDIVIVMDGLKDLSVIMNFPADVIRFIRKEFKSISLREDFYDALVGHIDVSPIREKRAMRIMDFLNNEIIN
ncbi:MAG: hypothetical protein SVK54_05635 [candidate division WOR-3 bacterium]|nr:hypothetical protein [candidate division WOR-3 bacterium]